MAARSLSLPRNSCTWWGCAICSRSCHSSVAASQKGMSCPGFPRQCQLSRFNKDICEPKPEQFPLWWLGWLAIMPAIPLEVPLPGPFPDPFPCPADSLRHSISQEATSLSARQACQTLYQCWASVYDAGPALKQCLVNVSHHLNWCFKLTHWEASSERLR